jgi:hypothetical protein
MYGLASFSLEVSKKYVAVAKLSLTSLPFIVIKYDLCFGYCFLKSVNQKIKSFKASCIYVFM